MAFTYKQFVTELRRLAQEAGDLREFEALGERPRSRKWRHELQDLLIPTLSN